MLSMPPDGGDDVPLRQVLERLRQGKPLPDTPCHTIRLIDEALGTAQRSSGASREQALLAGLGTIALRRLSSARGVVDPRPDPGLAVGRSAADAEADMGVDFRAGDPVREAWSALYYRYFAPDGLTAQRVAASMQVDPASFRRRVLRRVSQGIHLLDGALRDAATAARASGAMVRRDAAGNQTPRHNLPPRQHATFGRAALVAEVRGLLETSSLVTLVGPPGVGKSHVALEAIRPIVDCFPDGVWRVDLAMLDDPAQVPAAIARVLGVPDHPGRSPVLAILAHLHTLRLVLCLDNCGAVIGACATLVAQILSSCPQVRVLVASRERLRIDGECLRIVMPLAPPDDNLADDTTWHNPAVQIFVDLARRCRPTLALSPDDLRSVGQIVRRLDGVPLAVGAAARLAGTLGPRQIASRLEDPNALLALEGPAGGSHPSTLRATVARSYVRLRSEEQRLFDRSSAHAGCFGLDASDPDAGRAMCGLVERSLVLAERRAAGPWSYRMVEPGRAFGRAQVEARNTHDRGVVAP